LIRVYAGPFGEWRWIGESVTMPVNVMVMDKVPSNDRLTELGVSRISYGPIPYIHLMAALQQEAEKILS
jgi:2-methylisocitrate lyase-like PEP mutase family enzyme